MRRAVLGELLGNAEFGPKEGNKAMLIKTEVWVQVVHRKVGDPGLESTLGREPLQKEPKAGAWFWEWTYRINQIPAQMRSPRPWLSRQAWLKAVEVLPSFPSRSLRTPGNLHPSHHL